MFNLHASTKQVDSLKKKREEEEAIVAFRDHYIDITDSMLPVTACFKC